MKRSPTSDTWSPHFGGMERTPQESFRPWLKPFSTVEWWRHIRWTCSGPPSLSPVGICIFDYSGSTTVWLSGVRLIVWDDYIGVSCQITWSNAATPLTGQSYWKSANKHWVPVQRSFWGHFPVDQLIFSWKQAMYSRIQQQSKFAQV